MKRVLFVLGLTVALTAFAQRLTGIALYPAARFEFTNCAADGTTTPRRP